MTILRRAWWALARTAGRAEPPSPDYALIAALERDLGMGEPPRRAPARRTAPYCLRKDCDGVTKGRTVTGVVLRRLHRCG